MQVSIECPGLALLLALYQGAPEVVGAEIRTATEQSLQEVEAEVRSRAPEGATGRLRQGVQVLPVEEHGGVATGMVAVAGVPYAGFVEEGTGVYAGRSAWTVTPKRAKALRIPTRGGVIFRRRATIQGMRGRHYFAQGIQAARPRVLRHYADALARACRRLER